jgi:UDP-glucose 4-epimerase
LRFFNVVGPGQDPRSPYSGAVSLFAERLREGGGIDIFGDGKQTRDYVYVGDVVRALMLTLQAAAVTAPVFNGCSGATACRSLSRRANFSCDAAESGHELSRAAARRCPPQPR